MLPGVHIPRGKNAGRSDLLWPPAQRPSYSGSLWPFVLFVDVDVDVDLLHSLLIDVVSNSFIHSYHHFSSSSSIWLFL